MELVDGPTLADRIAQGALPLDESLPIARQIAEALEAAHERGIIHRDLKPANIKVRADGVVKVLDFGLAKAMEPTSAMSASASMSPTITSPAMTQAGMILGTAAYMSPEQARGKTADKRADVWAFGAVLFEMLTGRRAFPGEDITDTIVSVVSKEPDWRTLPAATPAGLRRLLARSLKKDPRARLQAIGDARVQIEELLSGAPDETPAAPGVPAAYPPLCRAQRGRACCRGHWPRRRSCSRSPRCCCGRHGARASPSPTALRFTPFAFEQGGQSNPVWAPDGKAVAFAARQKDTDPFQVYVRYLDSPLATPITHLAVARHSDRTGPSAGRIVLPINTGAGRTLVGLARGRRTTAISGYGRLNRTGDRGLYGVSVPGWLGSGLAASRRRWAGRPLDQLPTRQCAEAV